MGHILRNWRVLAAILFSAVLVVGAYMLAHGVEYPSIAQASAETALLQAIAAKDSDGDGLPDWEEVLYGTDPHVVDTFHLGMTDGEAVAKGLIIPKAIADIPLATSSPSSFPTDGSLPPPPAEGSLTDAFAKSFFTLYITAKQNAGGANLSDTDTQNIANEALNSLASSITVALDFKTAADIKVSGTGPDALRAFATLAEAVLKKNTTDATMNELIYLQNAVQNNDTTALIHLASIAKAYRDSAVGLTALPVPTELAADDLALVNAMMHVSEIINDFARVNTDSLTAILGLQQYLSASQSLGKAFTDVSNVYAAEGISLPMGAPGASFVNLMADMTARQQAATQIP